MLSPSFRLKVRLHCLETNHGNGKNVHVIQLEKGTDDCKHETQNSKKEQKIQTYRHDIGSIIYVNEVCV